MRHDRSTATPFWPVALLLIAASAIYCAPLFQHLDWYGWQDWDQFTFRYETARLAIVRDHEWPFWNPYANGGTVLLAHPHFPALSPWFVIVLLLGAQVGLRVQVFALMAIGAIGMALWARHHGRSTPASVFAGVVLMMSAHFALHITEGHLEWTTLGLMPWVALGMERALQGRTTAILGTAVVLASALLLGAIYIPAIFLPFFTIWACALAVYSRRWAPMRIWCVVALVAIGLSAVKLVPNVGFALQVPREKTEFQRTTLHTMLSAWLRPDQAALYVQYRGSTLEDPPTEDPEARPLLIDAEFHEYGAYLGVAGTLLALLGVGLSWGRHWPLYVSAAVFGVMAFGVVSPLDLWALLRQLPLYEQLHVPSRTLVVVVFAAAFASAAGLDAVLSPHVSRRRQWIAWAIVSVASIELLVMGRSLFSQVFRIPPPVTAPFDTFAHRPAPPEASSLVPATMKSLLVPALRSNSGTLNGYENLSIPKGQVRSVDDPEYRGEAYFTEEESRAAITRWTMSTQEIAVTASSHSTLIINQNFDRGWKAAYTVGGRRTPLVVRATGDGLIGVEVPGGSGVVRLSYWPPGLTLGALLSLATVVLSLAWWRWSNRS